MNSTTNIVTLELMQPVAHEAEKSGDSLSGRPNLRGLYRVALARERGAILVIILAGILALIPVMVWGIPSGGDLANHYRFALPFYDSLHSGHLYPGWLAESNYGFGDARFRFYPPGLYFVLALLKLLMGWYSASVLAFVLLTVVGGLGTYFWARGSYPIKVAMWAGVIYTIAPYHLNQLYQASLLSEYAACSVLPFVFAFTQRVCRRRRFADVGGLAAAYALLILTHLPLTVIGSLSVLVYALFLLRRDRLWSTVARLAVGVFLGLAASAFFWTTMLAELSWIKGNSAHQNIYYDYRANFLFSSAALANRNTWYANVLALAVIGLLLPAVIFFKKKVVGSATKAAILLTVVSFLMATEVSRPLWLIIPKLREVQFPWRWLAITSLCGSVVLAAGLPKWKQLWRTGFRPLHLVPVLGVLLSLFFIVTQVVWDSEYLPRQEFDSLVTNIRGAPSFKDWLPIWASEGLEPYLKKDRVNADSRPVTITSWESQHREFTIEAGQAGEARVQTFYYPLWTASSGNRALEVKPAQDGAILISLPADKTVVTLNFREPPRVQGVRIVSSIAWFMIAAFCVQGLYQARGRRLIQNSHQPVETV